MGSIGISKNFLIGVFLIQAPPWNNRLGLGPLENIGVKNTKSQFECQRLDHRVGKGQVILSESEKF